jgi:chromosome segregation protein
MPCHLKSLELQGYKTFASRTVFEFAPTVTAIVGPNGSGKSNIADSLRWVLGEQSYALLRGRKTEDMIFAGSEQRPRAGMASATVLFDNTDGWLPIDFSEVAITRRAYRDGTNEYLINGQRVRLKDVSELLAQSGLAERTYTIIGQGLVDAALALKAEERRRLFEEAAGIGLHRSRREEALRRLDTTARNLDRVQDILAELQPRLRSLERQARRAQEFEQVKADLKLLLREWYGYHWHAAQKDLGLTRDGVRLQEEALNRAKTEAEAADQRLSALRERISGLRARLNSWHRQSAGLHARREELSRQRAVAEERLRSLGQQGNDLQSEIARLKEEAQLQEERLAVAAAEEKRLGEELAEARSQVEAARRSLSARQAEREKAEGELQAARQALSGLNNRQGQLQARLAERQSQAARQQRALDEAAGSAAAAEGDVLAAKNLMEAAGQALEARRLAHGEASQALGEHQQTIHTRESARKETLDRQAAQMAELARLQAQLEVLERAEKALTGYASGAQVLLKAAQQNRLTGARGALSSQLVVPAEYELAIAAALGEWVDAVLLEQAADLETALELLAREAARGGLLPLDGLVPPAPLAVERAASSQEDGLVGLASDLVSAPPELRPAVDLLLGQTLVVTGRQAARRLLAGRGPTARAVTLKGEVFHASGQILAGMEGRSATISRPRERRDLQAGLEESQGRVGEIEVRLVELDGELQTLQTEAGELEAAARAARLAEERARDAHHAARAALEGAEKQARWQAGQQARLEAELERGKQEAAQLSEDLAYTEAEIAKARETVRQRVNALGELSLEDYQAQASHWNTLAAVAERSLGAGKARLRETQEMLERVGRNLDSTGSRLAQVEAGLKAVETEKAAQRQAETQVNAEIEALHQLLEPAEKELDEAEAEQEKLQAVEAAARQVLTAAEHHYAQARIALARETEALDTLRRRIEDDFGLVAFEYSEEVSGQAPLPLEGMVEQLPRVKQLSPELDENIKRQRAQLRRIGAINPEARAEYIEVKQRFGFLTEQVADLEKAQEDIRQVIAELDELMQREFRKTFDAVAEHFKTIFTRLFGGGTARLVLTDPEDLTQTGIDIEARLPGRRTQGLSLLSGGERSLTANSLVFALLKVSPTPFCVLDEVDAMLDETNVGRFRELMRELSQNTQFVVVTHNRNTVQAADVIYGVTMGRDSVSQVISLKLDEVSEIYSNEN